MSQNARASLRRPLPGTEISPRFHFIIHVGVNLAIVVALLAGGDAAVLAIVTSGALVLTSLAIAARPQRGVLLLAALVPFDGLLPSRPFPLG